MIEMPSSLRSNSTSKAGWVRLGAGGHLHIIDHAPGIDNGFGAGPGAKALHLIGGGAAKNDLKAIDTHLDPVIFRRAAPKSRAKFVSMKSAAARAPRNDRPPAAASAIRLAAIAGPRRAGRLEGRGELAIRDALGLFPT